MNQPRPFREERFIDSRPSGPFVNLKGVDTLSAYQRHLLRVLADAALECAALLDSMATVHQILQVGRHQILEGSNRSAIAKPHIDALISELMSLEEAYGLELTNRVKRGDGIA